ncbi:MAG: hypothetical protein AB1792_10070 [Candidatus Zixiibacteriota bacterium]
MGLIALAPFVFAFAFSMSLTSSEVSEAAGLCTCTHWCPPLGRNVIWHKVDADCIWVSYCEECDIP